MSIVVDSRLLAKIKRFLHIVKSKLDYLFKGYAPHRAETIEEKNWERHRIIYIGCSCGKVWWIDAAFKQQLIDSGNIIQSPLVSDTET